MAEVHVTIDGFGNPVIEAKKTKGKKCLALTKPFEDTLSGGKASRTLKPEYHEDEVVVKKQAKVGGGY